MFGSAPGGPTGPDNNGKMHPQDIKNLVIFVLIAGCLYLMYDHMILKPQADMLRQRQQAMTQLSADQVKEITGHKKVPRAQALAEDPRVKIANGKITGSIDLKGARIDDVALNDYYETIEKKDHVTVLSPQDAAFPRHIAHGWVADGNVPLPGDDTLWQVEGNDTLSQGKPLTLKWDNGHGLIFRNTYAIDDQYLITLSQSVTNNSGAKVTLYPYGLVTQRGLDPDFHPVWIVHEGPITFSGHELHQVAYTKMWRQKDVQFDGNDGWTGITDKYWLSSIIPPQGQAVKYRYRYNGFPPAKKGQVDTGKYQVDYTGAALELQPGQSGTVESHVFVGAKKVLMLEDYSKKLNIPSFDLAVDFGWFWFMSKPFFLALHMIAEYTNIGFAMIALTILIRMAAFPLTNISYRSFAKMKKVAPQVAALRKEHGLDKGKLQEELVKLYQREGVNPMSGCLPMFIQIPIFFSLYKVLVNTIEMRQAPFYGWIHDMSAPDPTSIFNLFGLVPWHMPEWLPHIGVWPCLMLVGMMVQRRLNPPPQDPVQRDMAIWFPFLMTYMMSHFASGLVIYWTIGAYLGIAQQVYIMRSLGVPIYLFGEDETERKLEEAIKEGPAVHPLIGLAEQDAEEALFGDDDNPGPGVTPPRPRRKKKK